MGEPTTIAEAAAEVFAKVPVSMVFRVGHSLTLQLQRLVTALVRAGRELAGDRPLGEQGLLELALAYNFCVQIFSFAVVGIESAQFTQ